MEPAGSTQWQPSNEFSAAASLCARRLRDASMAARSRQKEIVLRRLARARRVYHDVHHNLADCVCAESDRDHLVELGVYLGCVVVVLQVPQRSPW